MPDVPEWFDLDRDEPEDKPKLPDWQFAHDPLHAPEPMFWDRLRSSEREEPDLVSDARRELARWKNAFFAHNVSPSLFPRPTPIGSIETPPVWWYVNADESE